MSYRYDALLSPIRIGDAVIKNRTMYPNASPHFLQGPETYPADSFMTFMGGRSHYYAGRVVQSQPALRTGRGCQADAEL